MARDSIILEETIVNWTSGPPFTGKFRVRYRFTTKSERQQKRCEKLVERLTEVHETLPKHFEVDMVCGGRGGEATSYTVTFTFKASYMSIHDRKSFVRRFLKEALDARYERAARSGRVWIWPKNPLVDEMELAIADTT